MRSVRTLFEQALLVMTLNRWKGPVYFAVSDYQGGLGAVLEEFGFAPFCDRVRMVKHMVKWVRESVASAAPLVETASEIVPTTYAPPKTVASSAHPSTHAHSGDAL